MGPCIVENSTVDGERARKALQLTAIKKSIPEAAFVKSPLRATAHMLFDYAVWFGATYAIYYTSQNGTFQALPQYQQYLATFAFWNIAGFFMWCIFVVGHDCGHGTFSDSELLNDIVGHFTHGSILVPFYPWQLSHRRHHMYHNHIEKDYSHPWYDEARMEHPDEGLARFMEKNAIIRIIFPFIGWPLYLYGMPDGSHFIPFSNQRVWAESQEAQTKESIKCIISAINVVAWAAGVYYFLFPNLAAFAYYYLAPLMFFGWWLVSVTYLQHHAEDTLVYDNDNWNFVESAFETVDRKFGFGIDTLHHHITDGHVAHHLFFTKIPHYNLPIATKAIQKYMKENSLDFMYKLEKTYDFVYRTHSNFVKIGFKAHRAPPSAKSPLEAKSGDVKKTK